MIKMRGIIKISPSKHISWHRYLQLLRSIFFSLLQDDLYVFTFSRKERTLTLRQDHQTNSGLQLLKKEDKLLKKEDKLDKKINIHCFNAHLTTKQSLAERVTPRLSCFVFGAQQTNAPIYTERASQTHLAEVLKWCMVGTGKVQRKSFMMREMRWVKTQFHLQSLLF